MYPLTTKKRQPGLASRTNFSNLALFRSLGTAENALRCLLATMAGDARGFPDPPAFLEFFTGMLTRIARHPR